MDHTPVASPPDGGSPSPTPGSGVFTRPVISWALYDLANTVFSMNVVSYFLSVWIVTEMNQPDAVWSVATAVSMFAMLITAPLLGAISDQAGRRLGLLLLSTIACVTLTFFLATPGVMGTLVLFVFANYFFQAGLVFYDALLPVVSTPANRGRVSGFGVGVGYIGSFIGVGVGLLILDPMGYAAVFRATALIFMVFAIPIFVFVREPGRAEAGSRIAIGDAFRRVRHTVGRVKRYPGLGRFLIGRAFYADAANTLIAFMGIYVTEELGFSGGTRDILVMSAIAAAIVGGLAWGPIVDRLGPKRTLDWVLFSWGITLVFGALIPLLGLPRALFWGVAALAGISLGGTWSSDRPYMLILSPPAQIGEFYGLYSMVGRFAAVIGPLLWAFVAEGHELFGIEVGLGLGRPAAVLTLALMVGVSYAILRGVDDRPREWSPEELGTA